MSSHVRRPVGVTIAFVVLLLSGVIGLIGGVGGLLGGIAAVSAPASEGAEELGAGVAIFAGVTLVVAILSLILAFGVFRGNRVARMIVTILKGLGLVSSGYSLISTGVFEWSTILSILFALVIILLLWMPEETRRFFSRA